MPPVMREVYSSNVSQIGYDPETSELLVTWKSGKTSAYSGVPMDTADTVMNDWSVGQAVRTLVVPSYKHRYVG